MAAEAGSTPFAVLPLPYARLVFCALFNIVKFFLAVMGYFPREIQHSLQLPLLVCLAQEDFFYCSLFAKAV